MEVNRIISITIECFALIISILISLFLLIQKRREGTERVILRMMLLSVILLLGDILAYAYRGEPGNTGWIMVRLCNYVVYVSNYLILVCYGKVLQLYLKTEDRRQIRMFKLVKWMCYASVVMVIAAQFGSWLYYFDEGNYYHRGSWFLLTQVAPVIGGLIYYVLIGINRKRINRNMLAALLIYLTLPYLGTMFQLFVYGYPAQTVAGIIGCWGIFFAREIEVRNQLARTIRLEKERQEQLEKVLSTVEEQYSVLQSMSEIFYSVHTIDLVTDTVKEISARNEVKDSVTSTHGATRMMRDTVSLTTSDESREAALKFTNLTTLPYRMQTRKMISGEFVGKRLGWYRAQFIKIDEDEFGCPLRVVLTTQSIDEEKRQAQMLLQMSMTDELTGFYNRRAYEEDTARVSRDPDREGMVYISFDVNGLKLCNDTLGHAAGDELILGATSSMEKAFGDLGRLYRIGGDEFVAILTVSEQMLAERLERFEKLMKDWSGEKVKKLSVSYGIVYGKEHMEASAEEVAVLADQRMYQSKRSYYEKSGHDRRHR
ncbi:MAG: diguanylate cyclase [Lachnospiraceae bacterium]|nr:diguanylate cyclase [Lachnospiraceae bacterium]